MTDLAWAQALAAGDAEAWARFQREAAPVVLRALRREGADAEGALQDLSLKLCEDSGRRLKAFRGEASLVTWAVVIALRLAREEAGRERAVRAAERLRPPPRVSEGRIPEEILHRLPPEDRLLVRLVYWDSATLAEASVILGIPANTLSPRLTEIRRRLKVLLESEK